MRGVKTHVGEARMRNMIVGTLCANKTPMTLDALAMEIAAKCQPGIWDTLKGLMAEGDITYDGTHFHVRLELCPMLEPAIAPEAVVPTSC